LSLALFDLVSFSLYLVQLSLVLLSDALLLLFKRRPKLGCVFDFLTAWEYLRVHRLYLVFEQSLVLLSLEEFVRADLKGVDCGVFVSLSLLFLRLQLRYIFALHAAN